MKGTAHVRAPAATDNGESMVAYDLNRTARWTLYTAGVIYLILGALLASRPFFIDFSPAALIGVGMIIAGANSLVPHFSIGNNPLRPVWFLPIGVIDVIFGIVFISRIGLLFFSMTTIIGAWMILAALIRVHMARQLKGAGDAGWRYALASAAVITAVALLLFSNRGLAEFWELLLTGSSLVGVGCIMLIEGRMIYGKR